jgi:hypothetical protein
VYDAAWLGCRETGDHLADGRPGQAARHGEIDVVSHDDALSTRTFVISANAPVDPG